MAAKKAKAGYPNIGEVVTVKVAIPYCGIQKGEVLKYRFTDSMRHMLDLGYWEIVK